MYKISAQSNAYARHQYSLDYTLKSLARLGYDGVEVDADHIKSLRLWEIPKEQRKLLKKSIADLGIELEALSAHTHVLQGGSWTSSDPKSKKIGMEWTKHVIDLAVEFGSKVITTHVPSPQTRAPKLLPGMPLEAYRVRDPDMFRMLRGLRRSYSEEDRKLIVQGCGELADYCEDRGVILAIEQYGDFWIDLIKDVGSPALKINLHVAVVWWEMLRTKGVIDEPSLPEAVHKLGSLLAHVHCMDYKIVPYLPPLPIYPQIALPQIVESIGAPMLIRPITECIPGAGECDYVAFIKALKEVGYTGYLTIESHRSDIPPEIELAWALKKMRSLIRNAEA